MTANVLDDSPRAQSQASESGHGNKRRLQAKAGLSLPEIVEDGEKSTESSQQNMKSSDSRMSQTSKHSKQGRHKPVDTKGQFILALANQRNLYVVIYRNYFLCIIFCLHTLSVCYSVE